MEVINGTVQSIESKGGSNDKGPWTMQIVTLEDGTKHSTFDTIPKTWIVGASVQFEREIKGKYSNIKKILGSTPSQPIPVTPSPQPTAPAQAVPEPQNKLTLGIAEKVPHPSGANYSSKEYTAMYSINTELDPQKADAIMEVLQGIVNARKEKDKSSPSSHKGTGESPSDKELETLNKNLEERMKGKSLIDETFEKQGERKKDDIRQFM